LVLVSLAFVPVTSQAAATVILDGTSTTATGILDLIVGGSSYDVTFPATSATALYGPHPNQIFPFPGSIAADEAMLAALIALNNSDAESVGTADPGNRQFLLGYGVNDLESGVWVTTGEYLIDNWIGPGDRELVAFDNISVYADFQPTTADNGVMVFVTSLSYDGNFPGLAGADAACTTAANNAGLPGTWTAWLSDNDTDAVDRIFNNAGTSYQLVDGTVIADSLADLLDGTLDSPIQVDETGTPIPGGAVEVWTATGTDGTNPGVGTCSNWTTNVDTQVARIGRLNAVDATWTDAGGGQSCELFNRLYCFADQVVPTGPVDLTGTVEGAGGTPLCSLVLASGQFMFSCNPNGPFSLLDLPTENNGTVKRQVYADGFFPNVEVLQGSVDETVVMTRVSSGSGACPDYNTPYEPGVFPDSAGKQVDISGTVLLQDTQTPVCALVLGNGQFGFTCDGTGSYAANIPLDNNGQFKLQVYADGFAPSIQVFDEFSLINNVRMARVVECQ
jgi:hypothetical protein